MASSIGGTKLFVPQPPAKGSFPLDHYGECKTWMKKYMNCLAKTNSKAAECKEYSKEYLKCRMDKDLMTKEDLKFLGFDGDKEDVK